MIRTLKDNLGFSNISKIEHFKPFVLWKEGRFRSFHSSQRIYMQLL
ncbi:hypothetical protein LEP1GSC052_0396 [Leptospira kmetyi serovar Malaysia str. Bejo-Iso9]|nr:hypothetical protein LEP1GSC052_0396 [Leptospira kmetyi serovar Malaysia str. Bejo-Iso9]